MRVLAKRVVAQAEAGAGYPFHLLAVAGVGFASDYADRHRASVTREDLTCLKENRDLLAFGDGRQGRLVPLAVFLPAYLGLDSAEAIGAYFELLADGLAGRGFGPFLARHAESFARLRHWLYDVREPWLASHADLREAILRLGDACRRNYPAYEQAVWPLERMEAEPVARRLNAYLEAADLIGRWEAATGLEFRFDRYTIVLCGAIKNGPNANSLGYDRTVFYYGTGFEWTTQFISHEVGTHILVDVFKEAMGEHDFGRLYRAYECLARFYNRQLVLRAPLVYTLPGYGDEQFGPAYAALRAANPRVTPGELLHGALRAAGR